MARPTQKLIQVSAPALLGKEREYVLDALERNELTWNGWYVQLFERAFAQFCGTRFAVSCSSGTAALHLALLALGIGPGDDVFVPALTYIATANAVRYVGANVILVDVRPDTWTIDTMDLCRKVNRSKQPKAIIPVHLYGLPADMNAVWRCTGRAMTVIEDAAEAHGATYQDLTVGSIGTLGAFSFYGSKVLTTGEGGMVTTNDEELAQRIWMFRGQGVAQTDRRYFHSHVGYNYRMTNVQAAIGLAQLETYGQHAERRALVVGAYKRLLGGRFEIQGLPSDRTSSNWMFSVLLPSDVSRDVVMSKMDERGVETRPFFVPLNEQPAFCGPELPVTADLSRRGLNLPTHALLSDDDVSQVCQNLLEVVDHVRT